MTVYLTHEDWSRVVASAVQEERERCAGLAYEVCASTRHVTLGTQCADVIMGRIPVKEWREKNERDRIS